MLDSTNQRCTNQIYINHPDYTMVDIVFGSNLRIPMYYTSKSDTINTHYHRNTAHKKF
jgi:hypothetical protein